MSCLIPPPLLGDGTVDWVRVRRGVELAGRNADAGTALPPMARFRGIQGILARQIGRIILYLSRVVTSRQRQFNQGVLETVRSLAHGARGHEDGIRALGRRVTALEQHLSERALASSDPDGPQPVGDADDLPTHDGNLLLHELRSRELRRMPPGAKTVLSGGCSGAWYFKWFKDNYPFVERHLGVEYYSPRPEQLPPEVEWVQDRLGNMSHVPAGSVDLVFAGQVIEHVWPFDLADFLSEANRVLRPGGVLVLDSPNRRVTHPLKWYQPEHTAELTVEEICELLEAAGFPDIEVRGVWLCYDRQGHSLLPLAAEPAPLNWPASVRARLATNRPEDSFIWWAEARKGTTQPDVARLRQRADEIFEYVRPITLARFQTEVGWAEGSGRNRVVRAAPGEAGFLVYGPHVPLAPGKYEATFFVGGAGSGAGRQQVACELQVTSDNGKQVHACKPVAVAELAAGRLSAIVVPFELADTVFAAELRVLSTGRCGVAARLHVDLDQR